MSNLWWEEVTAVDVVPW